MSKSINVRRTVDDFKNVVISFIKEEPRIYSSFSEQFAMNRAKKKLEVPDVKNKSRRYSECWNNWLSYDFGLRDLHLDSDSVQRIRSRSYKHFGSSSIVFKTENVSLTNGSTVVSTKGRGSVEDKLERLEWTCTAGCFERFSLTVYHHRALKAVARKKIKAHCFANKINLRGLSKELFEKFSSLPKRKIGLAIFRFLFRAIVTIVPGSRFSTVPKNNEKDRPINMEPFGNQVVQRQIGLYFKQVIKAEFNIDLDTSADLHRAALSLKIATIDLSNASDSITRTLIRKIFPRHVVDVLESSRSPYVYDPVSGDYHYPYKISSMGNGYTFELMTYILLCLTRSFDENSSVFGDDIIVKDECASQVIDSLKGIGFVPNLSKTAYGTNPFRESCGANWHSTEGYILSVDLTFPNDIVECIVFYNKVERLSRRYRSFERLERSLRRVVPDALRGRSSKEEHGPLSDFRYDDYFHIDKHSRPAVPRKIREYLLSVQQDPDAFYVVRSFKKVSKHSSKTTRSLRSDQLGKYFMYLRAGRVCDNLLVGITQTAPISYVCGPGYSVSCSSVPTF